MREPRAADAMRHNPIPQVAGEDVLRIKAEFRDLNINTPDPPAAAEGRPWPNASSSAIL
jgi:hypothetical protein